MVLENMDFEAKHNRLYNQIENLKVKIRISKNDREDYEEELDEKHVELYGLMKKEIDKNRGGQKSLENFAKLYSE